MDANRTQAQAETPQSIIDQNHESLSLDPEGYETEALGDAASYFCKLYVNLIPGACATG